MPVTAKLSRKFYELFGDEIANELVTWFNDVDANYRADLRELNELNFARFDAKVEQRFAGRILAFDDATAERWGQVEAFAKKRRQTLPTVDAQLAATGLQHNLTVVTRNTGDIGPTGVPVFNPWSG